MFDRESVTKVKYKTIENVIGMTKKEAKEKLSLFDVEYVGEGNLVIEQTPKAGTRYYETGKVKLLLSNK